MNNLKFGDQIICCFKDKRLVSPYADHDEEIDLTVLSLDDDDKGCFVYVPEYLGIKSTFIINKYNIKALGVPSKYVDSFCLYVSYSSISRIHNRADGLNCTRCNEFCYQAEPNQDDGSFLCFLCRTYRFR